MTQNKNLSCDSNSEKYKEFLPLLLANRDKVYGYILTLIPRPNIADDIMQETVLVMWEKFNDFTIGTNFCAWSKCIALNKIREYLRSAKRSPILFDEGVINKLNIQDIEEDPDQSKMKKLETCLKALSKVETQIIRLRFIDNTSVKTIAHAWGKTPQFVYRQMSKILYKLRICISKKIAGTGA